ncbi:MAG TPA: FAD-dependent oxidoreductase [Stellaceae bacterium]|nr:FAD-dependent oxidoreductase [Stellaceae bacterium]
MPEAVAIRCCIVGGGPAGMMLGLLLARAGVDVLVLEKHADFFRDFRGDTIHPSTLEVIRELGMLDAFLALPHQEVKELSADVFGARVAIADFTHLRAHCRFVALMPQWDFLNFLATQAKCFPRFALRKQSEAIELIETPAGVCGVKALTPAGLLEVHADLVVGADGRHSTIRQQARLETEQLGAPIDVLWFRLTRRTADRAETGGYVRPGSFFVMINRDDYWQCGYVIRKGAFDAIRREDISAFRARIVRAAPFTAGVIEGLEHWDDVKLLTVQVDRLRQWFKPGLLCIGDAAHAMSPVGGVGINLAIQDAVAAANILTEPLRRGPPSAADLQAVQRRREWPVRVTQSVQVMVQSRVVARVLDDAGPRKRALPLPLRLLRRFAVLRRIPARLVGFGVRPEHVAELGH